MPLAAVTYRGSMSEIYGTATGQTIAPSTAQMRAAMPDLPWHAEEHVCLPGVSLSARSRDGNAVFEYGLGKNAIVAVIAGTILDYAVQRRRLEHRGCHFTTNSHAELFLLGFLLDSCAFVQKLDGSFAAAIWDGRHQQLHLVSDRFGMKPLYYSARPGRLSFGTKIGPLLHQAGVSGRLSETGVAQFFRFRQFLGEDTLYEDIQLVPASSCLTCDVAAGSIRISRYWDLRRAFDGAPAPSEAAALEGIEAAFRRSMKRCLSDAGPLGLSLSAGLDSRTILAFVPGHMPLSCVTLGSPGSMDCRLAGRLAGTFGRPHHACVLDNRFRSEYEAQFRRMVELTDGQYVSTAIVMPSLAVYRSLGVNTLLRGHGGELMHMDKAYGYSLADPCAGPEGKALAPWLCQRLGGALPETEARALLRPPYRETVGAASQASLDAACEEAAEVGPASRSISYLFIRQFLRRATALSMAKFGSVAETRLPFVDREVIAALMAAPPGLRFGDAIQTWLLRREAPALLDVPNSNTGAPLGAGALRRQLCHGRLRVLARLGMPGYQPYERVGRWLRQDLQPFMRSVLLSAACLDRGVLAPDAVRQIIDDHTGGRRNHTFLIITMMVFELGQQMRTEKKTNDAFWHEQVS